MASVRPRLSTYHAALARRSATETAKKPPTADIDGEATDDGEATADGLGATDGEPLEQPATRSPTTRTMPAELRRKISIREL